MKKQKMLYRLMKILGIAVIIIGGIVYMKQKQLNEEMVNMIKSDRVAQLIESELKRLDSKALAAEGIVHSYEIYYESIEPNRLGGINVELIINQDKELTLGLVVNERRNQLVNDGLVLSEKLDRLIERADQS
ncbi:DUF1310 family protein [Enterococcus hirae]|uniref:DUF1310 family protein n=1 Tax=Enterococcus hirae TaxID=1354 RepID=UPI000F70DBF9|nr:DUF1310 family protein [Enterococcus hirae]MBA5270384.1 DUF1310 family protein [Enterococcus hirae]MDU4895185.1 DUF1310 family protein [Enterococcus hirae]NVM00348.1 DUF1310 family protein [Enterococcus hirae]VEE77620.1 Protein of uncharacterised function (DUF1310) [Enterococcus hirae]